MAEGKNDLIKLIINDEGVLFLNDNTKKVKAIPVGAPVIVNLQHEVEKIEYFAPVNANAYCLGVVGSIELSMKRIIHNLNCRMLNDSYYPVQYYKIIKK